MSIIDNITGIVAGILLFFIGVGTNKLHVKFFVPKKKDGTPDLRYRQWSYLGRAFQIGGVLTTLFFAINLVWTIRQ